MCTGVLKACTVEMSDQASQDRLTDPALCSEPSEHNGRVYSFLRHRIHLVASPSVYWTFHSMCVLCRHICVGMYQILIVPGSCSQLSAPLCVLVCCESIS